MPTRRQILKASTVGGAALLVPTAYLVRTPAYADPVPGGTLDPKTITKYVHPLYVPPTLTARSGPGGVDAYEIAVRQVNQRVLPPGHPTTRVFAFGALSGGAGFHWPGPTIEARVGPGTLLVAVLYPGELVDRLPTEHHDVPVHAVVTPDGLTRF